MSIQRRTSKASRLLLAGAVVTICFAAGVLSVLATREAGESPSPALPTESGPPLGDLFVSLGEDDQKVILILGTKELFDEQPDLLAVWLATYRPPGQDVYLYGFPVDWKPDGGGGQTLRQLFAWSDSGDVAAAFVDALPLQPDVHLALDSAAFAGVVDFLGGATLGGSEMNGTQVTAELEAESGQPRALLTLQARILQSLIDRAAGLGATPDLTPLMEQIPDHAFSSLPTVSLVSNFSPMLPLNPEKIHIQLLAQE